MVFLFSKEKVHYTMFIVLIFGLYSTSHAQKNYARPKIKPEKTIEVKYGPIVQQHRKNAAMEAFVIKIALGKTSDVAKNKGSAKM